MAQNSDAGSIGEAFERGLTTHRHGRDQSWIFFYRISCIILSVKVSLAKITPVTHSLTYMLECATVD